MLAEEFAQHRVGETGRRPDASKRHALAWWLDVGLFALYALLMAPRISGLTLHEWLGMALAIPVLVHALISWRWIATGARRMFAPARRRDTVNYILNVLLFVTTTVVVTSGIAISQVALPWLGVGTIDDRAWRLMHNRWTTFMWMAVGAHLAMNWRWIVAAARRHLAKPRRSA